MLKETAVLMKFSAGREGGSMKRLYAMIPGSPTKGEDRVKITSHWSATKVYVSRLVKSSGCWGKKRWLIDRASIRKEEIVIPGKEDA